MKGLFPNSNTNSAEKSNFSATNDSKDFTMNDGDDKIFDLKNKMRYLKVALLKEREGREESLRKIDKSKISIDQLLRSIESEV